MLRPHLDKSLNKIEPASGTQKRTRIPKYVTLEFHVLQTIITYSMATSQEFPVFVESSMAENTLQNIAPLLLIELSL